jgi:hypothetical protein
VSSDAQAAEVDPLGASPNGPQLSTDTIVPPGSASIRPDSAGFLYVTPNGVAKDFAQDLPAAQTAVMAATQGPIFGKTFDEKVSNAAGKASHRGTSSPRRTG